MRRSKQARAFPVVVGSNVRKARNGAGLTQTAFGKKLRIDAPTVSRIESGQKDLRTSELFEVGRALDVPPAALLAPVDEAR